MNPPVSLAALLMFLPFILPASLAQTPTSPSQPAQASNDLGQFLVAAHQENGLHEPNGEPWHVRATWQMLTSDGKTSEQGTWEEWWAGPHQWEQTFGSPNLQQTYWDTPKGTFALNNHGVSDWIYVLIAQMVGNPIKLARDPASIPLRAITFRKSHVALNCLIPKNFSRNPMVSEYCFDTGRHDLRMKIMPSVQITLNSIVKFEGRYLAREIDVARIGMPTIKIHLDVIDEPYPSGRVHG